MLDIDDIADAIRDGIYGDDRATGEEIGAALNALHTLLDEVRRLQSGGCARDQRTTQFCDEAATKDVEIRRLTSELAAAQAGPVVEWRQKGPDVEEAHRNAFLLSVSIKGWQLLIWTKHHNFIPVDSGPETGDAGKAACLAAYRRAIGLPCP